MDLTPYQIITIGITLGGMVLSGGIGAMVAHFRAEKKISLVEQSLVEANNAIEKLAQNTTEAVKDAHGRIKGVEERCQQRHKELREDTQYIRNRIDQVAGVKGD